VWALFEDQRAADDTLTSDGFVASGVKLLRVHPGEKGVNRKGVYLAAP
jgi:hypothetical protein